MQTTAKYYDGKTSARHEVILTLDGAGHLSVNGLTTEGEVISRQYSINDISFPAHVGNMRYSLPLPEGARCEIDDYQAFAALIKPFRKTSLQHLIHHWENKLLYALLAIVLSIVALWATVEYALPVMAGIVAREIPLSLEKKLGQQSLTILDKTMFEPSQLPPERQRALQKEFNAFIGEKDIHVIFRKSEQIGANAFALPSGIIVFTDDIVALAQDDRELLGVLAHEIGHIKKRHVMRHILQDSATVVLLVMLTGDVSSASSLAASIPTILVQTKHSRAFEEEADHFAAEDMLQHNISPSYLGSILKRLMDEHKGTGVPDFLSTHPNTQHRIEELNQYAKHFKAT